MRNLIRGVAWLGAAVAIVGGATVAIGQTRNEPADVGVDGGAHVGNP